MSFKQETFVTANTKVDGVNHKSNVTIDWTGMSDEDMQKLAQRSLIIRKQNADRVKGVIPEERYTIKAVNYKIGARAPSEPINVEKLLANLPEEERTKLLEKYL